MDKQRKDFQKYFIKRPDSTFSPERNKFVVEKTIKKHDANIKKRKKQYKDQVTERSDAVQDFLKHIDRGNTTPVEKYFGKKTMAYLRGEKISRDIKRSKLQGI